MRTDGDVTKRHASLTRINPNVRVLSSTPPRRPEDSPSGAALRPTFTAMWGEVCFASSRQEVNGSRTAVTLLHLDFPPPDTQAGI
jgi:hypothetical protein